MGARPDTRFIPEDALIIRHKVMKLVGRCGITRSDQPDLRQELAFHVSMQMSRFDPSRGTRRTYVNRISQNKILNILEQRRARKRGSGKSIMAIDEETEEMVPDPHGDGDSVDMTLDVATAIASLPPDLRHLATCLMTESPAEAGRTLGLTRGQVRHRIGLIGQHFARYLTNFNNQSDHHSGR